MSPEVLPFRSRPYAPELRFAEIHGHQRAYRMGGSGPVVLLLHGIADNSLVWEQVMVQLTDRYTVIAPDLLGHGLSDRPRADYSVAAFANGMRDLLCYLGVDRASVVGHSLGGGVAGQFAYQFPDMVERLVFVAPGGVDHDVSPLLRLLSLPFSEQVVALTALPGAKQILGAALDVAAALPVPARADLVQLRLALDRMPNTASPHAFARTLRSVVDLRGQVVTMRDRCYLTAEVPTLVARGTDDSIIPAAHAEVLRATLPAATVTLFEGVGHFPMMEAPERFLEVLTGFLTSTEPARLVRTHLRDGLRSAAGVRMPEPAQELG
ncbi:haloalkane dehalogenase OS=Tsukamurella paurometabola (strain ATCC 8368 / DSM / CCUG 35730 /CIP 100753 / JCM 10117 / KCTC 9821 / NBRC 16120 / NCIMB 702349/ NCTC 13040) OX=521096 GN=Tpau_1823 PE=4 SV=1 [Tsukamurella paurometabola]|uniref:Alpha/beta hydrolase fold protein n=1 Tax=Tsukamurella paurometabola (strain ATCC 8368 / DSM 20162 / CCUG 35730 / CIP 100753 / JCM 10117 / KCTC 9821 / NBRC 16120 / NCIMB 702349 / NCTC 13040) TaxID=521096 RepID=D5UMU4_TSUPD|nr:alpha/beta hydrolase [Tsukamurella paurometabola]ADG78441.1 alpha/beta hydrolase fold protein [Tsukamurella paurometabola DSM 20162]SUP31645.1 Soluble epoxide hydrolase [Tsukamurella paurometabola]